MTYKEWSERQAKMAMVGRDIAAAARRTYKVQPLKVLDSGTGNMCDIPSMLTVEVYADLERPFNVRVLLVDGTEGHAKADETDDFELEYLIKVRGIVQMWKDGKLDELPKEIT